MKLLYIAAAAVLIAAGPVVKMVKANDAQAACCGCCISGSCDCDTCCCCDCTACPACSKK